MIFRLKVNMYEKRSVPDGSAPVGTTCYESSPCPAHYMIGCIGKYPLIRTSYIGKYIPYSLRLAVSVPSLLSRVSCIGEYLMCSLVRRIGKYFTYPLVRRIGKYLINSLVKRIGKYLTLSLTTCS